MRYPRFTICLAIAALLAGGCGQGAPTHRPAITAIIAPGKDTPANLPGNSFRLVLEVRNGLQAKAIPSDVLSVTVSFTGASLASPYTQTIAASQFIDSTAQLVVSGLNGGTYNVTVKLWDAAGGTGNILAQGSMDVGVVSGLSTSAQLVLIYGSAATPGGVSGQVDFNAPPVSITAMGVDPATVPGPGYPATITVTTNRADQDSLLYQYSSDGGTFDGSGRIIQWTAPQNQGGAFSITVQVEDGVHPRVSQSVSISVPSGAATATGSASFTNFS